MWLFCVFCFSNLQFSISHTTRKPREGEQDGVHYNFTTVDAIKEEIEAGKFVEYAEVHGNYYGTSVAAVQTVQEQGKICLLDIDIQGAQNVKKSDLDALYIFISPPSMEELEKRLRGRGTEKEDAILRRLGNAQTEMDYGAGVGNFDCVLVWVCNSACVMMFWMCFLLICNLIRLLCRYCTVQ